MFGYIFGIVKTGLNCTQGKIIGVTVTIQVSGQGPLTPPLQQNPADPCTWHYATPCPAGAGDISAVCNSCGATGSVPIQVPAGMPVQAAPIDLTSECP